MVRIIPNAPFIPFKKDCGGLSTKLMIWLLCNYAVICGTSLYEANYPRALYWFAAFLITSSVVWMGK